MQDDFLGRWPGVHVRTTYLKSYSVNLTVYRAFKLAEMELSAYPLLFQTLPVLIQYCFASKEQILATLLPEVHFALPVDDAGIKKDVRWEMNGVDVPTVKLSTGEIRKGELPLDLRLVCESDFI